MDIMSEIQNINNWKRTSRKVYKAYACIPPAGTFVKCDFKNTILKTGEDKRVVIFGAFGYFPIRLRDLVTQYVMADGSEITEKDIQKRAVAGGVPYVKWFEIKSKPSNETIWAFRVPEEIRDFSVPVAGGGTLKANARGKDYCDFIICPDINGAPFIDRMEFCNGILFENTFDMRAFPGKATGRTIKEIIKPKELMESTAGIKSDTQLTRDEAGKVLTTNENRAIKFKEELKNQNDKYLNITNELLTRFGQQLFYHLKHETDIRVTVKPSGMATEEDEQYIDYEIQGDIVCKNAGTVVECRVFYRVDIHNTKTVEDIDPRVMLSADVYQVDEAKQRREHIYEVRRTEIQCRTSRLLSSDEGLDMITGKATVVAEGIKKATAAPELEICNREDIEIKYTEYLDNIAKGILQHFWIECGRAGVEQDYRLKTVKRQSRQKTAIARSSYVGLVVAKTRNPKMIEVRIKVGFSIYDDDVSLETIYNPKVGFLDISVATMSEECNWSMDISNRGKAYESLNGGIYRQLVSTLMDYMRNNPDRYKPVTRVSGGEGGITKQDVSGQGIRKVVFGEKETLVDSIKSMFGKFKR